MVESENDISFCQLNKVMSRVSVMLRILESNARPSACKYPADYSQLKTSTFKCNYHICCIIGCIKFQRIPTKYRGVETVLNKIPSLHRQTSLQDLVASIILLSHLFVVPVKMKSRFLKYVVIVFYELSSFAFHVSFVSTISWRKKT